MKMVLHIDYASDPLRVQAAHRVSENWRIRQRLPLITALALRLGYIQS